MITKNGTKWTFRHNYSTGDNVRDDLGEKSPEELYSDTCSEEVFEIFNGFVPYGEYGIHTIKSIKVFNILSIETLI